MFLQVRFLPSQLKRPLRSVAFVKMGIERKKADSIAKYLEVMGYEPKMDEVNSVVVHDKIITMTSAALKGLSDVMNGCSISITRSGEKARIRIWQ